MRRGGFILLVLISGLAWGAATGSLAAAPESGQEHSPVAGGHAAPAGPFDSSLNKILDLAIWTVVVFVVLMFVLRKYAWAPMLAGLQKREENIRSALAEAQAAREEAAAARADLQKQLAAAHEQVRAILDEGRRDAQQLRDQEMARTQAEMQAERDRLRREIEMQTDQALQRIWAQAADLATLASAKALGKGITADGHRKLIDEALGEIKASGAVRHA
jgi:F-type H+-transporting ATPase subunit b